jgi:hypothetical protein
MTAQKGGPLDRSGPRTMLLHATRKKSKSRNAVDRGPSRSMRAGSPARAIALTPAQQREAQRLTPLMRALLRAAAPNGCQIGGSHLRSAHILERRGFLQITPEGGGWHLVTLTPAGTEANRGDERESRARSAASALCPKYATCG